MKDNNEFPYVWDRDNMPKNHKGKKCRIITTNKRDRHRA